MIVMPMDLDDFLYMFSNTLHFPANNTMKNCFVCLDFVEVVTECTTGIYVKLKFHEYSFFFKKESISMHLYCIGTYFVNSEFFLKYYFTYKQSSYFTALLTFYFL
jgi:hypothetical protein